MHEVATIGGNGVVGAKVLSLRLHRARVQVEGGTGRTKAQVQG